MEKTNVINNGVVRLDVHDLASVCVLGSGVTGSAVMSYFSALKNPPVLDLYTDDAEVTKHYDLAVVSPGIPPHSRMVTSAKKMVDELISEPELAFRLAPERWIVITGTNGKTTTTALCAHILNESGMPARIAGNIGVPCIEAISARQPSEYIVAELSSYQLEYSSTLTPVAAVLLNITPDHLDWHGGFDAYRRAKLSIFARMHKNEAAIIDATMACTHDVVLERNACAQRVIALGTKAGIVAKMDDFAAGAECAYVDADSAQLSCRIAGKASTLISRDEMHIKGAHNCENALAAACVALSLGANEQKVAGALSSFEPLEHRIEFVREIDGVSFYNDSKATNPEATNKAISSFPGKKLIVMLGGKDKGTSLDEMVEQLNRFAVAAVCFGEAGARLYEALTKKPNGATNGEGSHAPDVLRADGFDGAFAASLTYIYQKEYADAVLLLSPACASYDEFDSYIARGNHFKCLVNELAAEQTTSNHHDEEVNHEQ